MYRDIFSNLIYIILVIVITNREDVVKFHQSLIDLPNVQKLKRVNERPNIEAGQVAGHVYCWY